MRPWATKINGKQSNELFKNIVVKEGWSIESFVVISINYQYEKMESASRKK